MTRRFPSLLCAARRLSPQFDSTPRNATKRHEAFFPAPQRHATTSIYRTTTPRHALRFHPTQRDYTSLHVSHLCASQLNPPLLAATQRSAFIETVLSPTRNAPNRTADQRNAALFDAAQRIESQRLATLRRAARRCTVSRTAPMRNFPQLAAPF
jgi:hypothetical protein